MSSAPVDELASCPFCGSVAVRVIELPATLDDRIAVACTACEATGPPVAGRDAWKALLGWNKRQIHH